VNHLQATASGVILWAVGIGQGIPMLQVGGLIIGLVGVICGPPGP
jgi:hypothetical protein